MTRQVQTFNVQTSQFFITWPQSGFNIDEAFEALKNIVISTVKPIKTLIAEELHEDGNKHHHAYVRFPKKVHLKDPRAFDLFEKHANIQGCRSPAKVIQYVIKGGVYKADFEIKTSRSMRVRKIIEKVSKADDFINECIEDDPEWAISRFPAIRAFADYRFKTNGGKCSPLRDISEFVNVPELVEAFKHDLKDHVRGERDMKSLWIWGDSRLGKTQLARSLGTHCYMQGIWNMSCLSDDVEYAIFDDMKFDNIEYMYKQIFGMQVDVNFTGKYMRPTTFKWGIPVIFITNVLYPFNWEQQSWMDANVNFVHINESLF